MLSPLLFFFIDYSHLRIIHAMYKIQCNSSFCSFTHHHIIILILSIILAFIRLMSGTSLAIWATTSVEINECNGGLCKQLINHRDTYSCNYMLCYCHNQGGRVPWYSWHLRMLSLKLVSISMLANQRVIQISP